MSDGLLGITFKQLQAFVAIAKLGTLGAAADALGISQPSISRHIKALEQKCGPLFVRSTGRRMSLSGKGYLLYRRAPGLLKLIDEIATELKEADVGPSLVRVVSPDYIHGLLKGVMADFLLRYPEYSVALKTVATEEEGIAAVAREQADLFYIGKLDGADIPRSSIVARAGVGLYATPEFAQSQGPVENTEALPMILPRQGSVEGEFVGEILARSGIIPQRVKVHAEHIETAKALCLRGAGIAVLFDESAAAEVQAGRLVKLDRLSPDVLRCCFAGANSNHHLGAQLFRKEASEFFNDIAKRA